MTGKAILFGSKKLSDLYTFNNEFIRSLPLPTLNQVNYNTTLGDNMIVFRPGGTHEHNTRIHGGDIRLKSWLGFSRSIAVNCNGYVKEGVYPEEEYLVKVNYSGKVRSVCNTLSLNVNYSALISLIMSVTSSEMASYTVIRVMSISMVTPSVCLGK